MQGTTDIIYLTIHAIITIGGLITFLLRHEHRLTRIETKIEYIEKALKC